MPTACIFWHLGRSKPAHTKAICPRSFLLLYSWLQGAKLAAGPAKGAVLLAHPLESGWFERATVLLCSHDSNRGSFGLTLNRPLPRWPTKWTEDSDDSSADEVSLSLAAVLDGRSQFCCQMVSAS